VLLTDALATSYFGAQLGDIAEGDVVAVFGAGPVGLFAAKSAWFVGAGRFRWWARTARCSTR
jgi:S-(hydroxymethyl)glutathione dehydrogenase/alcohol dehydrogenase